MALLAVNVAVVAVEVDAVAVEVDVLAVEVNVLAVWVNVLAVWVGAVLVVGGAILVAAELIAVVAGMARELSLHGVAERALPRLVGEAVGQGERGDEAAGGVAGDAAGRADEAARGIEPDRRVEGQADAGDQRRQPCERVGGAPRRGLGVERRASRERGEDARSQQRGGGPVRQREA